MSASVCRAIRKTELSLSHVGDMYLKIFGFEGGAAHAGLTARGERSSIDRASARTCDFIGRRMDGWMRALASPVGSGLTGAVYV